jgi:two-component system response regulator
MLAKQTILLVEDNQDDADLTIMAFQESKICNTVIHVKDGVEALDYLFKRGKFENFASYDLPAIILLDLNLPKLDGIEVLKAIRADSQTKYLPIVILTSSNEDKDRLRAYEHHANSYVQKPVDYDAFQEAAIKLGLYWLLLNQQPGKKVM